MKYPENTWLLEYKYEGMILNIQKIPFDEFKDDFRRSGADKHKFSQDVRCYLEEKNLIQGFDSIGWVSVPGEQLGTGGFVYNWISGVQPKFEFMGMQRLDSLG